MVGSKMRRIIAGFTEFRRPSRALASGSVNTGGLPSGVTFEDTNGNAWYIFVDVGGALRIAPAASVEPNPQTNPVTYDFATAAAAFTATPFQKSITAMSDATFTDTMTVTVPNVACGAAIFVVVQGALGAGGAIGAYEAVASQILTISVARTVGVAAVGNQATVGITSNAAVAGAATIALANQLSSISGAVGATNTFTLQTRVTKGSGSSTNHVANIMAWMFNATVGGVSLS